MSETISFPPIAETNGSAKRTPTVYFIDDSATMREVIKIAFRRENICVITCGDAASAMAQFEQNPPDAVITDVIMPDQDGYSVCSQIKQHQRFGRTPVILMSGVVNKNVADKAVSVGADELIRKPFQPVDLIARVKSFLEPKSPAQPVVPAAPAPRVPAPSPLSSLFAPQPPAKAPIPTVPAIPAVDPSRESAWPAALANAFQPQPPLASQNFQPSAPVAPSFPPQQQQPIRPPAAAGDIQKLKTEISRLELLIKKLQTELQIERQYNQALELHVKSLTSLD
jgi:CheY-like chemotaxis protein